MNTRNQDKTKEQKPSKKEGNLYDKLLHEIGDSTILPIVTESLGIEVLQIAVREAKMQYTIEREVDKCYLIKTKENKNILLHIEYQRDNDRKMVYRVSLYAALLRYYHPELKIESVVVYVGDGEPTMRTELYENEIYTGFILINAKTFDHKKLLASKYPSQVITAILGDYAIERAEEMIRCIVHRLRKICNSEMELIKLTKQLLVLSFLRNLGSLTQKILKDMSVHIDIANTDVFKNAYRDELAEFDRRMRESQIAFENERMAKEEERRAKEAAHQAKEKERIEKEMAWQATILSLFKHTKLTAEQIANESKIPLEFVLKTKKEFNL